MENVVLIVHLVLALSLIGAVLLQRSEGGGLGFSGGGTMTGRGAATAMAKVTWGLAVAFIATSIAMTIIAAENAGGSSVVDRIRDDTDPATIPAENEPAPATPLGGDLLPPMAGDGPVIPEAE
ncbi:preprotein translocase subunit SecG [Pseudoroseicyclus aestuarii]|uniref:Protein-export membrane protein SecG n=1 Tax=Pseudoroseicyclus aestuarii TaxID=1795041 RepID=A0A318T5N3_9RHOB|nr:preprotein translocase subunit SecG [Pseudoroseicyclus aestuarii]PYE85704.1 preprotein translocase subunit SecG [Pseudoroseicyclus aestuarii]